MNSLYNCSWLNKTTIIHESYDSRYQFITESLADTLKDTMSKIKKLKIGTPYRDSRLFFFQFLEDEFNEQIPDEYKVKKIVSPAQALDFAQKNANPEKRLSRLKKEEEDFKYKLQIGSTRLLFNLKDKAPKDLRVKDLKVEDIESAEEIFTRQKYGMDVNDIYLKMIGSQKDPTAFIKEVDEKFKKYSSEKHEGSQDDRLTFYLNMKAGFRTHRGVKGDPITPSKPERELSPKTDIERVVKGQEFMPGVSGYHTVMTNLLPTDKLTFVSRGVGPYKIFKAKAGSYEFRINLKNVDASDKTVEQINPDDLGGVYVYDTSLPGKSITDMPAPVTLKSPARIYEPEVGELPPEGPEDREDLPEIEPEPEPEFDEFDEREEEEETPCVHGCKCSKCMQQRDTTPPTSSSKPREITIKLSTEAINRQMIESYRRKQQSNHRIDRRNMLGY